MTTKKLFPSVWLTLIAWGAISLLPKQNSFCTAAVWSIPGAESLFTNINRIEFQNVQLPATGNVKLSPAIILCCSLPETAVWQIAADRRDNLYLGTGSRTRLYTKSARRHSAQLIWENDAGEILALTIAADGTVLFGTTPEGKVYRYSAGGTPQPLYTTGETYIHALLTAPDKSVLCATGPNGKLYRIYPDGRGELIFTAPQAHLTALHWLKPGRELLIGTSPAGIIYHLLITPGEKPRSTVFYDSPQEEIRTILSDNRGNVYAAGNPGGDEIGPGNSQPEVYRIDQNGILRWQWSCPDSAIFHLHMLHSDILVLTGNRGIIYSLDTLGQPTIFCRLEEPQVITASSADRVTYLGTANPARIYHLTADYADSGFVTSPVFDCANPARFGRIDRKTRIPQGAELTIETRSGNSSLPDSTWSPWQPATADVASPPGRFIQWRAKLYSRFPSVTPELERVDIYYQPVNRPPAITKLEINQPTPGEARRGTSQPKIPVSWEANDPDDDSLVFNLFIQAKEDRTWQQLARDLNENRYEFDTRTVPDGWYRIRLVASDRIDQPTPLSAERISPLFLIDNTPPLITGIKITGNRITWTATDAISPITACRISLNAGPWVPVAPVDGIFDDTEELFSYQPQLTTLPEIVAIWVTDAAGNLSTAREKFRRP